jgi:predicted SnoaL-like aldol condensation-catalyzing enzyme
MESILWSYERGGLMKAIVVAIVLAVVSASALAAEPVIAVPAADQAALLRSSNPRLAANKRLVYDMWRTLLEGHRFDQASKFIAPEYHQHNPNAVTGRAGMVAYFKALHLKREPIPRDIDGLVSIVAERNMVILATARHLKDSQGRPYTTTWFDMFRIAHGKIVEHWDCALKM